MNRTDKIYAAATIAAVLGLLFYSPSTSLENQNPQGELNLTEMRGIFIHSYNDEGINPETVVATCAANGVTDIFVEIGGINYARYTSAAFPASLDWGLFPEFIDECHSNGLKCHAVMNVIAEGGLGEGYMCTRYNNGSPTAGATANPIFNATRALLKAEVEELAAFDIDGFMFDYTRFVWGDEPYDDTSRTAFVAATGIAAENWGAETHMDGGDYRDEWFAWRAGVLTDLVGDMKGWMTAVNADLEFSAAVFNFAHYEPGQPWPAFRYFWSKYYGQDSVAWATAGHVDYVCPMIYVDNVSYLTTCYTNLAATFSVPVKPFIDSCDAGWSTMQNLADRITALRAEEAPGWVIWRYGGDGDISDSPDLQDMFDLLETPTPSTPAIPLLISYRRRQ